VHEHEEEERHATGSVDVVELLCDGGRVDPDEHEDDENDDSAICDGPERRGSRLALLFRRLESRVRSPDVTS
jgi:hypothetical protein